MPGGQGPLQLRSRTLQLDLEPARGARCNALHWLHPDGLGRTPLLRPQYDTSDEVLHSACFAMVPYSNRLFDGRLITPQGVRTLPMNLARLPHPVHGLGWRTAWQVADHEPHRVRLHYTHVADMHWPYAHSVDQTIGIAGSKVRFELEMRNESGLPMPAGLGWHPCFAIDPQTEIRLHAPEVWALDESGKPLACEDTKGHPQCDFSNARYANGIVLNHCFRKWDGVVDIARPEVGLTIQMRASDNLRNLVVYRTAGHPWLCIEPVSHATGAFSLDGINNHRNGIQILHPGECVHGWIEMHIGHHDS